MVRRHLTYANVIATLALFVALGGASYAALKLPKNSVGSKQLRTGAVGSRAVANHSLKVGDFKSGQLPRGPRGVRGQTGAAGPGAAKFWAKISSANGAQQPTVRASSGGVTVQKVGGGFENVTFPADVSQCAIEITVAGGPAGVTYRNTGQGTGATVNTVMEQVSGGTVTTVNEPYDIAAFC